MGNGKETGFSLVELIITIVIIGILAGLVVFSPKTFLVSARDQERADDIVSIARQLEQAYTSQALGYPAYPSTNELAADISPSRTRTMKGIRPEALQAPGGSTNSIIGATTAITAGAGTPLLSQYMYQPLTAAGITCTGAPSVGSPCVSFYLYYRRESDDSIQKIKSIHQQ